jgi:hypothetical protein
MSTKAEIACPGLFSGKHFAYFFKQALNPEYCDEVDRDKTSDWAG